MKIRLLPHHIYYFLVFLVLINIIMLAGTWLFHFYYYDVLEGRWEDGSSVKYILREFSLGTENTIATWYSSKLLLSVGIMSFFCFMIIKKNFTKDRKNFLRYGWMMFILIFSILSLDELASLHERIGNITALNPIADQPPGWVLLLAFPIGAVGIFMLYFCWMQFKNAPLAIVFAVTGILLFISIPFQEHLELKYWYSAADMDTWMRPVHLLLFEEGSEIMGATCIFVSILLFVAYTTNPTQRLTFKPSLNIEFPLNKKVFLFRLSIACFLTGLLIVLLQESSFLDAEGDIGVRLNWLPSAAGYLVAVLSLYIFYRTKSSLRSYSNTYLFLVFFSLFMSAYYGSNIYDYFNWLLTDSWRYIFMGFIFLVGIILGLSLFMLTKGFYKKIGVALWVILLLVAIEINTRYSAAIAYVAFSVLLLNLFSQILKEPKQSLKPGESLIP